MTASRAFWNRVEAQVAGEGFAVQEQRRSGQGAGPEGKHVDARPRVAQALVVPHQGPGVGSGEMAEADRLGGAGVGEAGHGHVVAFPALLGQGLHEGGHGTTQAIDRRTNPEPQRGHGLLVAAASQVGLAGEVPHGLAQTGLHEAVDVLGVALEARGVRLGPGQDLRQAEVEGRGLVAGEGAAPLQGLHEGPRGGDLLGKQAAVEGEGAVEVPEGTVGVPGVVAAPQLHER
jgi:hypothetical protein